MQIELIEFELINLQSVFTLYFGNYTVEVIPVLFFYPVPLLFYALILLTEFLFPLAWILLIVIEEGFALAQKIRGTVHSILNAISASILTKRVIM